MAKKKTLKRGKLPKFVKVILWVLGVLVGIAVVVCVGVKMWMSTWKVDKQPDFTISYPQGWHADYGATKLPAPYMFFIASNPTIAGNSVDFSKSKLWIQLNVIRKADPKSAADLKNINEIISSGIQVGQVYVKVSLPTKMQFVTSKGGIYFEAFVDSANAYLPRNYLSKLSNLAVGFLILSTLH